MKKIIKIIVSITVLCSMGICFHACGKDVQENKAIEVYRVPYEEFDCDYKEGDYLAVEQSGKTLYIPDCYGEILNVSANESCIVIRHRDLIAEQVLTNYPVRYEEMHWLIDFSGDGFPDLTFCTEYILARSFSSTKTHFLIWDMETSSYQPEIFPKQEVYEEIIFRPLWNTELSAVLFFAGSDIEDRIIMHMYAYSDSGWKIIRRLAPVYEGNGDDQTETSAYIGYQEIFYDNNEIISRHMVEFEGINAIWFDTGSVWCKDNVTNIQLYPSEEWQKITVQEEGVTFTKYVRCGNNNAFEED